MPKDKTEIDEVIEVGILEVIRDQFKMVLRHLPIEVLESYAKKEIEINFSELAREILKEIKDKESWMKKDKKKHST